MMVDGFVQQWKFDGEGFVKLEHRRSGSWEMIED